MRRFHISRLIMLVAVVAACSKKPPPAPPPAPAPAPTVNQDSIDAARRAAEAAATRAREAAAAAAAAAAAEASRMEAARADARRKLDAAVYFDYDMDEIRADQAATLDAKVPVLNANADIRLRISGHTDERGSDEYNIALGQRRAAAVRRYLVARGVSEARMEVESFGEQRPAMQGMDESAWSRNRRAEFTLTAGGNPIRVP
ncbi:MAG: peptidoglycan-associated lipoprotein Pal [Gemmatimonadetes bacterium]|nr:peptidoglycan-associated lipoprotein Pal [Gemmatimonadota bacterium]